MSKYIGPRIRIVRRLGELPALTQKEQNRNTRPGQHGLARKKQTQFSYRLVEKQKIRFYYRISEKYLVRCVQVARKMIGPTGQLLLQQLEIRLDNLTYRLGWAKTLLSARQLVSHGHILVNCKVRHIGSFYCRPHQVVIVKNKENILRCVRKNSREFTQIFPDHISLNSSNFGAIVNQWANWRKLPLSLNELLVIEYYSNRL